MLNSELGNYLGKQRIYTPGARKVQFNMPFVLACNPFSNSHKSRTCTSTNVWECGFLSYQQTGILA